jgi:hypothetical protein
MFYFNVYSVLRRQNMIYPLVIFHISCAFTVQICFAQEYVCFCQTNCDAMDKHFETTIIHLVLKVFNCLCGC